MTWAEVAKELSTEPVFGKVTVFGSQYLANQMLARQSCLSGDVVLEVGTPEDYRAVNLTPTEAKALIVWLQAHLED